jgi:2'-hydroxyisoflavone reductase
MRQADPMRILVLGGTQFIGRHLVTELLRSGHEITTLNRGVTPDHLPDDVERLRGDRDLGVPGLSALQAGRWDACVDLSGYTAVHVRSSVEALRDRVGRYVFVSAISVHGDVREGPIDETSPLVDAAPEDVTEVVGETYGRLKVTCERIVGDAFGERAAILRPQVVVGPHDPTPRLARWVRRARRPETMLVPGDGSDALQVVDVHDLVRFARLVAERDLAGTYAVSGERVTWRSFVGMLAPADPVWIPKAILEEAGLASDDLPLYRATGAPRSGLMHVRNDRAKAAGFVVTPLKETVERVRTSMATDVPATDAPADSVERQLIARARRAARER